MGDASQKKTSKAATPAELRAPSAAERVAIRSAHERQAKRAARAKVIVTTEADGSLKVSNPHADVRGWSAQIEETFGTTSSAFSNQSFARIATAVTDKGKPVSEGRVNAALAVMGAIAPQSELEALIGEQIIATHIASLDFLSRARMNAGEYRDSAAVYANMAAKLSRTMAAHVDALSKLRGGGRQRIEVVYVNGPAVIGDNAQAVVAGGGGDAGRNVGQPHAPGALPHLAAAVVPAMRGQDTEGCALSGAGGERPEAVPNAWREEPGGADRDG